MADTGSPLAPGLFQGNVDGINAFANYWNAHGGIGCRQIKVSVWDSKLSATESKNGLINACKNALAMVGGNALFNPDVSPMTGCVDKSGVAGGLPDLAAIASDINEECAKGVYIIQTVYERCPIVPGRPRPQVEVSGAAKWYVDNVLKGTEPRGLYLVPNLGSSLQSAMGIIAAQRQVGLNLDDTLKVGGGDSQAAFTPRVQSIKQHASNFVYNGSNDRAMINMRKEATAQGVDTVKLWACSLSCYTRAFMASGGADVEGTYIYMQFLPFEEASANPELQRYLNGVGVGKADSFGAQAWQAGVLFKQVIDEIVASHGPNGITRANMLTALDNVKDFTANGWLGKKDLRGSNPCFVIMQVKNGKWSRVYPAKVGTLDCSSGNVTTVTLDPASEAAKIR
jgi:hypothetical protein